MSDWGKGFFRDMEFPPPPRSVVYLASEEEDEDDVKGGRRKNGALHTGEGRRKYRRFLA